MHWRNSPSGFDEAFDSASSPRRHYNAIVDCLGAMNPRELKRREMLQDISLRNQGITFNVYGAKDGEERVFPFDFVPRIITAEEWKELERGLIQRVTAINLFLQDVYTDQKVLHQGIVPWELILSRKEYRRELRNVVPPRQIYTHIVGTDIIRDGDGTFRVLEDNCRCPSGVSYVVENRNILQRTFPELFSQYAVRPVRNYPEMLLKTLGHAAPGWGKDGMPVVLTPGRYNSAYFEHSFLAREMGIPLVEGSDLVVEKNQVFVKTIEGKQRVGVIYRRLDDDYLDPLTFDRHSILGVPGLINAYRSGNVALANAPGAGVADDKAVYAYIPEIIRFYLDEEPLLQQVTTFTGFKQDDYEYMIENLDKVVVKTTGGAGGYDMLMGPMATKQEIAAYARKVKANPSSFIAQPLIELSSHPTYIDRSYQPRRVDLRPFILFGEQIRILPGGLTRVALREGSYVVNSSQGGGSKDTWVLEDRPA